MEFNVSISVVIWIAQILFVASLVIQALFLFGFHIRLAFYKKREPNPSFPPVSVIIAAKNEYQNLLENLPSILEQDYPNFEVVVVNDASWDDTPSLLQEFKKRYSNLKIANCPDSDAFFGGKKLAITIGVKAASHDQLVFTDADCKPLNRQWLKSMVSAINGEASIVLGFSPYARSKGLLNAVIRFDTWYVGMNYLSFALAGIPYMGVGRNMSYRKNDFFKVGGFKTHYHIKSGDDDLFINQVSNKRNTVISVGDSAWVESSPETTWRAYWNQKRRHLTTGWHYKWYHKLLLAIQPASLLIMLLSAGILILFHTWLYIVLAALIARILIQFFIFSRSSRWLGHGRLIFLAPLLEIINMFLSGFIFIANATSRQTKWKN
jgi:glycosyltransferase involved in cell wall biosynthesis